MSDTVLRSRIRSAVLVLRVNAIDDVTAILNHPLRF